MNKEALYSIRMRASAGGRHISGAERIVAREKIDPVMHELVTRANGKSIVPDQIVVKIDALDGTRIRTLTSLDLVTLRLPDVETGRSAVLRMLQSTGVSGHAAATAIKLLGNGAAGAGENMRGAMIMDAKSGDRLEPDRERGVRVSRFDWTEGASNKIDKSLAAVGLTHYRTREALALATKVAHAPGIVAELCWSDDPDYTAGYVASLSTGYVRFPFLKQSGDATGGRVFFVARDTVDMDALVRYFQADAVLIHDTGVCRSPIRPDEYFQEILTKRENV